MNFVFELSSSRGSTALHGIESFDAVETPRTRHFAAPTSPGPTSALRICHLNDYLPITKSIFLAHPLPHAVEPSPMQPATPSAASQPDPPKDPPATTLPANIGGLLQVARILLDYGRHLVDTLRPRAAAPGFSAIAANFGTANVATILAHLNRGILRCLALERVLLARAAAGRDIPFIERHTSITLLPEPGPTDAPEPPRPVPAAQPQAAEPLPRRRHAPRASRPAFWDDPELHMPTLEELERQIRRQPMGRVFLAIALDLAVVLGLCHPGLWSALFDIMNWFG